MTLGRYRTAPTRISPLDLNPSMTLGNVDRLPQTLEIDGTFFAPSAYLVADDINPATGAWASRHDPSKVLSVAGAGAAPTYGNVTAIENTAVNYAAAKYHQAADTTWGQTTVGDFAIECVLRVDASGGGRMVFSTYNGSGIALYVNPTQLVTLVYRATVDKCTEVINVSLSTYYHIFIGVDASEKLYFYANGAYQTSKAVVAYGGSIVGGALTVGAHPAGTNNGSSGVIAMGLWDLPTNPFPGALKNRTYFDRIARERFAIVAGIQDRRQGAHLFTRATTAYLDRYISSTERRAFFVSSGWPRVCTRKDANGLLVRQYLAELQATNRLAYSQDLTQAGTWTRAELTTVTAAAAAGPDGLMTLNGLVANATDTSHYIRQTYTTPATLHAVSWFARKGDKDWILANVTSVSNVYAYWNANTGAWGNIGAGVTAYDVEDWGGGLYRAWLIFTGDGNSIQYQFYSAPSNGTTNFAGDAATVNTYLGCVQVEAVTEHFPSSYIPTLAAAVVRNRDELSYATRLPIVGNINDLPQTINIGGTDYAPCAYLVADDCQADGTWTSRHAAKSLTFAGAGTNPTPQWYAVSRANTTVRYWASNYHRAADTTWGQIGDNDGVVEALFVCMDGNTISTRASGSLAGYGIGVSSGAISFIIGDGTDYINTVASNVQIAGTIVHFMAFIDKSDKCYYFVNGTYFGVSASTAAIGNSTGGALALGALSGGVSATAGMPALFAAWDLPTNPMPGAATNQAVAAAIARERFEAIFQLPSIRMDCEILHPNVNRQTRASFVNISVNQLDYISLMNETTDFGSSQAGYNNTWAWRASDGTVGTADIHDNVVRKLSISARRNLARYRENNAVVGTDASCEMPPCQQRIQVNMWAEGSSQPGSCIGNVKVWRNDR